MTERVWDFPASIKFSGQIFYVPGMFFDGGITAGGVRSMSPEPGGYSRLEIQNALAVNEWGAPSSSWIISKTNGQILKVRLALTPQIATASMINGKYVDSGVTRTFAANALAGANTVFIDFAGIGEILQPGHVIGHANDCYLVEDIIYDGADYAEITIIPPLRRNVTLGNAVLFRPYFTGYIANGGEIVALYSSDKVGNFEMPRIVLNEVIVP